MEFKDGVLEAYNFGDGRVVWEGGVPRFQYRLADHLGNTVVFFEDKNNNGCITTEEEATSPADLEIVQRLLYYPFGMALEGLGAWNAQPWQQYRYNGKERDTLTGWYDYSARWYLDGIGRFPSVDPLTDQMPGWSPYSYGFDNPVMFVDPDGRAPCPPGEDCDDPLDNMQIRRNRASNLGPGRVRNEGTKHHAGHDLYAPKGTNAKSVMKGKVVATGKHKQYGNFVTIEHSTDDSKYYSFYAHLSEVNVSKGDAVTLGQVIGKTGISGNAESGDGGLDEHLHFEFGTALRSDNKLLAAESLLDPNMAYKTVGFYSATPAARNQSNKSVIEHRIVPSSTNSFATEVISTLHPIIEGNGRRKKSPQVLSRDFVF